MGNIRIKGIDISIAVTIVTDTIARISVFPDKLADPPHRQFDAPDLSPRNWQSPAAVLSQTDSQEIQAGSFVISITGDPAELSVSRQGRVVQRFLFNDDRIYFDLTHSKLYGLGHGFATAMNRRGSMFDMAVNGQIRGIVDNGSATSAIPYLIGTAGWACFFHLPWKLIFNLYGVSDEPSKNGFDAYCERKDGDGWDLFVVDGAGPSDAVTAYYEITGCPPLPPKYAFGYQQSHRTLLHQNENFMKLTAKQLRESQFPCDMLIYLSTGYADAGWNIINGSLEFNREVFADPAGDIKNLQDSHYKIMLHDTRCHQSLHGIIDENNIDPDEEDHAQNYWARHERFLESTPVDAWWPDDGDELDIEARLARHRMFREGSLKMQSNTRPFALYRNGYAGMTRWGGVVWSGDNLCAWKTLERQIPIGLNVAVSFSPYWCTDTGGFFSTKEYDAELFIRWFQYSAFTPQFRSHGRPSWLHTPFGWNGYKPSQIPSEHYDNPYHTEMHEIDANVSPDPRVEPICRKFTELRYRLIPYLYTYARKTYDTGMPLMRPLWLSLGPDHWFSGVEDQYMLGESLLVCPIYAKAAVARAVALPEGTWYGLIDNKMYEGGAHVVVEAPLDTMPVLVPAGGILPMGDVTQYVGEEGHTDEGGFDNLEVLIYTGADGSFTLYEDDGISLAYEKGACTWTTFFWDNTEKRLSVTGISSVSPGKKRKMKARCIPNGDTFEVLCTYR